MTECTSTNYQNCLILSENQACLDKFSTFYNPLTGRFRTTCVENGQTNCVYTKLICQSGFECQTLANPQQGCFEKCTTNKSSIFYCRQDKSQYCNENQACYDPTQSIGSFTQTLNEIQIKYSFKFLLKVS
ncbi:unnamed protein product [Paramecium pentaurelia]|uniref:Uncharacterized protein n=1 Tax=Paramecium pentaurelia TaxID=43138 RepID=A0A8S1V9E3_9CILI|nr:unnamed protein product [Paramecium pentaurelia]